MQFSDVKRSRLWEKELRYFHRVKFTLINNFKTNRYEESAVSYLQGLLNRDHLKRSKDLKA